MPDAPQLVLGLRGHEQFAIGSTFKLWVLDALAGEIALGRLRWDQVVRLGQRSVPSGMMQDWPQGAAVTVETLATLMISRSDNTATDTLIRLLGREAVARRVIATRHSAPQRMLPILTTAEVFALKSGPEADRQAFLAVSEAGQARFLATYRRDEQLPRIDPAAVASDKPASIDTIEWFASANDIARVFDARTRRCWRSSRSIPACLPGCLNPSPTAATRADRNRG
jgi:beta-lactamase class A